VLVYRLPEIFARLSHHKDNLELLVVGDGPDGDGLRAALAEKCPWLKGALPGLLPHSEVLKVLPTQDVLLMPSNFEGMPIALIEAMAHGVVPIVSRLSGATDRVVQHGLNGFLAEPSNVAAFGANLDSLISDRELVQQCSQRAWETVRDKFSVTRMAGQYLQLVEEVVVERAVGGVRRRSGEVCMGLLGDFPQVPRLLVRPLRVARRLVRNFTSA